MDIYQQEDLCNIQSTMHWMWFDLYISVSPDNSIWRQQWPICKDILHTRRDSEDIHHTSGWGEDTSS